MKRTFITLSLLYSDSHVRPKQVKRYELVNNMPCSANKWGKNWLFRLQAEQPYHEIWYVEETRHCKAEGMHVTCQPRAKAYDMKIIETEQREGLQGKNWIQPFGLVTGSAICWYPTGREPVSCHRDVSTIRCALLYRQKKKCIRPFVFGFSKDWCRQMEFQTCMDEVFT